MSFKKWRGIGNGCANNTENQTHVMDARLLNIREGWPDDSKAAWRVLKTWREEQEG